MKNTEAKALSDMLATHMQYLQFLCNALSPGNDRRWRRRAVEPVRHRERSGESRLGREGREVPR